MGKLRGKGKGFQGLYLSSSPVDLIFYVELSPLHILSNKMPF